MSHLFVHVHHHVRNIRNIIWKTTQGLELCNFPTLALTSDFLPKSKHEREGLHE